MMFWHESKGGMAMNDVARLLGVAVSVTGSVYCLALLGDCRKRIRSLRSPTGPPRGSTRRGVLRTRTDCLCQLLLAAGFLAVVAVLLAGFTFHVASFLLREGSLQRQVRRTIETVSVPGCPPVIFNYDASRPDRPLAEIECARKPISDDQLRGLLRATRELVYLNLAYTDITDDALCELSRAPKLHMLCLDGTRIGDLTLQNLAKLKSLDILRLNDTKITDKGLRSLSDLKNLRELSLHDTAVTDAGLQWLRGLDKLELLDVENTGVTQEGVNRLKSTLPGVTIKPQWNED